MEGARFDCHDSRVQGGLRKIGAPVTRELVRIDKDDPQICQVGCFDYRSTHRQSREAQK